MKILILFLVVGSIFFQSCDKNHEPDMPFTSFSEDDLSYLLLKDDTLAITEGEKVYQDTILFLYNHVQFIRAAIKTEIHSFVPTLGIDQEKYISGSTKYVFLDQSTFKYAQIIISKTSNVRNVSQFFILRANGSEWEKGEHVSKDSLLQSIDLRGEVVHNVLVFNPQPDAESNLKSIFFAKHFGYVKIETTDGSLLERLFNN